MTDDDLHDTERALRDLFATHAAAVTPPAGLYAGARRLAHRRRAVVGATAGALVVAAGVPAGLAAARSGPTGTAAPTPARPTAPSPSPSGDLPGVYDDPQPPADVCRHPEDTPVTGPAFAAQRDVRGSLGGDRAAVRAVLRAAWARLTTQHGSRIRAGTLRALYVERVDGYVVAHVVGTDGSAPTKPVEYARDVSQVYVAGPDLDHLSAFRASGWTITGDGGSDPVPFDNKEVLTERQPVAGLAVCGRDYLVVRAAPGSTAERTGVTGLRPDGTEIRGVSSIPLRPDGLAVARVSPGTTVTVRTAGRAVATRREVPLSGDYRPLTDAQLDALTTGWDVGAVPADSRHQVLAFALVAQEPLTRRLPPADVRALWLADTDHGLSGLVTWTVPGGARLAYGFTRSGPKGAVTGYGGLVRSGSVDDLVVAWAGNALPAVVAPRGVRAEATLPGGAVRSVPMTRGGAVLPTGTTAVSVYDAGGRLLGRRAVNTGLTPLPGR
jgi:hypothetical protein